MDASQDASIEALVHQAYCWILGREGDPGGVAHYVESLRSGSIDERELRAIFVYSDEFQRQMSDSTMAVDVGGFSVVIEREDPELGSYISRTGGWEPNIRQAIRDNLPPGGVFVDVGANVGIMSFEASRIASKVIAFEPHPRNAQNLRRGIEANCIPNIVLHQMGLSDSLRLITTTLATNAKVQPNAPNLAQAIDGDSLLHREDRIDLIKIDVEGHEPSVLAGLRKTIETHRPRLIVEFNPACLGANGNDVAADLAREIFAFSQQVTPIEGDTCHDPIHTADALLALWAARAEARGPMLHFDLVTRPR